VADHKRRLYFFESALTPNTFWVDLNKVDFGGQVLKLDLGKDQRNTFAGDALGHFVPSAPFTFLGVDG
jgi:choloylglycine hydrolase